MLIFGQNLELTRNNFHRASESDPQRLVLVMKLIFRFFLVIYCTFMINQRISELDDIGLALAKLIVSINGVAVSGANFCVSCAH